MTGASETMADARHARRTEVMVGLTVIVLGVLLLTLAIPAWVPEPGSLRRPLMSPQLLPRLVGWLLVALGLCIALNARGAVRPDAEGSVGSSLRGLGVGVLVAAFYLGALPILGALLVAVVATTLLMLYRGERRWHVLVLAGALVPALAVTLLQRVASVPLPVGPFGF